MARVWKGDALYVPDVTLHQFVFSRAARFGNRTCVIDKGNGRTYSYLDIIDLSKRTASGMKTKLGMRQGDVIAFLKLNSADFLTTVFGSLAAGATVSTINPASTAYELKHYLTMLKPKFILTEPALLPKINEVKAATGLKPVVIVSGDQSTGNDVTLASLQSYPISSPDGAATKIDLKKTPALILFSSGTTGLPKGVVLSHYNVVASMTSIDGLLPDATVGITCFPMYHTAGLIVESFMKVIEGVTQVMFPRFDFEEYLKAIETYKPEAAIVPPPLIIMMAKSPLVKRYDLSSVKSVGVGAAATKKEVEDEFKARFNNPPIGQGYGMTEVTAGVITKSTKEGHVKPGSVGRIIRGCEAKVVDPVTGLDLEANKTGEVFMRGPSVMMGYLNNPGATAEILDKEGWIHSGDLGYYDNDGYFYIIDRIKELVKYKGYQVAPAELDAVILEHPDVADVAVIGVPDKMAGELPRAYVVRKEGSRVTEKGVSDFVDERVSHYKRLRGGVIFVDAIPKLPSGKILRRKLKELAMESKL